MQFIGAFDLSIDHYLMVLPTAIDARKVEHHEHHEHLRLDQLGGQLLMSLDRLAI